MDSKTEDDFWNTSSSSTFNFDDDEDTLLSCSSSDYVFNSTTEEGSSLPIDAIISKGNLSLVLDDINTTNEYVVPPIDETIKNIFHGYKYNLHQYRTLQDKLSLLDQANKTSDGNVIITVVLFLKETLNVNVFFNHLSTRKIAMTQYVSYLMTKKSFHELADLYTATGNTESMKNIYFLLCKESSNNHSLSKRIEHFMSEHSQNLNLTEDIEEHLKFIKWQMEHKQNYVSVIEQLAEFCRSEWEKNKNEENIIEFKKRFNIDDFQYEWTLMKVLVQLKLWKKLISIFIKPNWLTRKMGLKAVIKPDLFVIGLGKYGAPKDVLEQFLHCVSDSERSLELAHKFELHTFVINYYISQKDRLGLLNYKERLSSPDELQLVNDVLQSNDKKWKN